MMYIYIYMYKLIILSFILIFVLVLSRVYSYSSIYFLVFCWIVFWVICFYVAGNTIYQNWHWKLLLILTLLFYYQIWLYQHILFITLTFHFFILSLLLLNNPQKPIIHNLKKSNPISSKLSPNATSYSPTSLPLRMSLFWIKNRF